MTQDRGPKSRATKQNTACQEDITEPQQASAGNRITTTPGAEPRANRARRAARPGIRILVTSPEGHLQRVKHHGLSLPIDKRLSWVSRTARCRTPSGQVQFVRWTQDPSTHVL